MKNRWRTPDSYAISVAEADADLNDHYLRLEGRLPAETFARLREVQLSWLAYRDANDIWLSDYLTQDAS